MLDPSSFKTITRNGKELKAFRTDYHKNGKELKTSPYNMFYNSYPPSILKTAVAFPATVLRTSTSGNC